MGFFDNYNSSNFYNYGSADYDAYRDYGPNPGLVDYYAVPRTDYSKSFKPTAEESKFDFPGFLYGAGALAEGIGNALRGGPPVRMAQENLARYLNKGKQDPLTAMLAQISQKQGATNNPLIRPLLSGMFADTFSV